MKNLLFLTLFAWAPTAAAVIELPSFFSDGMVLQQQSGAKIWGWLDGGGTVTVTFASQTKNALTDEEGRWEVTFQGLSASGEGAEMTISDGTETKVINDVVVGEVWIASGQSNMEWPVSQSANPAEEIAASADPFLRVFLTGNVASPEPQIDFPGSWAAASPETTGKMTAVGYYFARKLRQELEVPVGIIECAWGGRPIESFISEEALQREPTAKAIVEKKEQAVAAWSEEEAKAQYETALAKWKEKGEKGRRPQQAVDPLFDSSKHSTIFSGMIAPLVGYGAKGVIWYQGESNANPMTASIYEELLGCLVRDWRQRWQSQLSFYYVQLANFRQATTEPGVESDWVVVQDEMRRALASIKRSGMAVANDIGDAADIHPKNKQEVAARLARWALAKDYKKEGIEVSGPLFQKAEKAEGRMVLTFQHNTGLQSRDDEPLQRFEIKAENGPWQWAQAKIEDGRVVVWSDEVEEPVAVRYAWAANPEGANLTNAAGLPASCFTTEK